MFRIVLTPLPRAAEMISRCAMDLLGGGVTEPESFFGVMRMSISALQSGRND